MKTFVLDTNILLDFPNALFAFEDNEVILPELVLEELDSFKRMNDEKGINTRQVNRYLEELRLKGDLLHGVILNDINGKLKIEINHVDIELPWNNLTKNDHRILQICKYYQQQLNKDVILITNDILLRIKSDIIGIKAEGFYKSQVPNIDLQYTGRFEVYLLDKDFDKFYNLGELLLEETSLLTYDNKGISSLYDEAIYPNEFVLLKNSSGDTALGKIDPTGKFLKKLEYKSYKPYGIKPKNIAQHFMIEALMNDIPLTILKAPAGCAKTLLSLACGLDQVIDNKKYRKILIARPSIQMGEQLGFLPGTEKEKIDPYMRSCYDNLEILIDSSPKDRYKNEDSLKSKIDYIFDSGYIDAQAVAFLRGRSITNQYVFIDECVSKYSRILTADNKSITIESLYKDNYLPVVMTYNEKDNKFEPKQVVNIVNKGYRKVLQIVTDNDEKIICTGNHLILTDKNWARADRLSLSTKLFTNKEFVNIKSIIYIQTEEEVFDLEVEDNHNFIINGFKDAIFDQGIVVHNCQNLTISQMRSIVTRAGDNTKLILAGDPQQIDVPYIDSTNNGLSWVSEKMKGSPWCVQVTAKNSECIRSKLAADAIQRLK